jgi:hypothetical protein
MTFDKAARLALDHERERLRNLDIKDGGNRLYEWTIATFSAEDEIIMAGRKVKAMSQAAELVAALQFVSVAGTKDDVPYKEYVVLNNKFAVACDGQITAGHPITEELECCPQLRQLTMALSSCGTSLSITELTNGQLSIAGDKLTAKIPCIAFDALPDQVLTLPDPICASIDDRLKAAFAVCGVMVSEAGGRAVECGLLLQANECTGTDGKILIQYWHGIDLPPGLFVPKIFAAAVCKVKSPLVGFGFSTGRSVTFHFEGGAWIKTQLYEDKYPNVGPIINADRRCEATLVPPDLFKAIATVGEFNNGVASIEAGKVKSENAEYEVEGLDASCSFLSEQTKIIAPFVKTIDMSSFEDRAFFFGENMRGVIMGIKRGVARQPLQEANPEIGSMQHRETTEEWRARGGPDSEIPF